MINTFLRYLHGTEIWSNYRPHIPTTIKRLTLLGILAITISFWPLRHNNLTIAANIILGLGTLLALPIIPIGLLVRWIQNYRSTTQNEILSLINWRGDETVLDVGCGSGMLLNGAATHLTSGKAIGIDIWVPFSGGGNLDLLWKNAREEGVANRIEFKEADARQLPFEDEMFDVVLSSGAVHHISHDSGNHEQAISEMLRVLKPGGQIVLGDVTDAINNCAEKIKKAGLKSEVRESQPFLGFEMNLLRSQKCI